MAAVSSSTSKTSADTLKILPSGTKIRLLDTGIFGVVGVYVDELYAIIEHRGCHDPRDHRLYCLRERRVQTGV
jgi:hypothetical protein